MKVDEINAPAQLVDHRCDGARYGARYSSLIIVVDSMTLVRYSDATMNPHTPLHGVRHGEVEEVFRIEH